MGQVVTHATELTAAALSSKQVTVGQTFKLAVQVQEVPTTYDFDDMPKLGFSLMRTDIGQQIDRTLRKEQE